MVISTTFDACLMRGPIPLTTRMPETISINVLTIDNHNIVRTTHPVPCDYLLLVWDFDPQQKRKPSVRSIRIQAADRLQPLLEPIDGPVSDMKVLRPTNQDAATRVFEELTTAEAETLEFIGSDDFVDVPV
jgi:hypothetical protein